jgi:hypothetical protein
MSFESGGKGIPGANTIFSFYIFGSVYDPLDAYAPIPTNISLGSLGTFDNTGNVWSSFLAGTSTGTTSFFPGMDDVDCNLTYTSFPAKVMANGYDLSTTTPTFCAGQLVSFSVTFYNQLPGSNIYCNWTLGGKVVNAFSNGSGGTYYLDNSILHGNSNNCSCWYYDGTNGTVSVAGTVWVDGKLMDFGAKGAFSIYRPTITNFTMPSPPFPPFITNYYSNSTSGEVLRVGDLTTGYGIIDYFGYIDSDYGGTAGITQIYDDQSYPNAIGSNVLDSSEFYPANGLRIPQPGPVSAGNCLGSYVGVLDTPHEGSGGATSVSLKLQFRDYIRFRPNAGGSNYNIYITLGKVTWSVDASATLTNNVWVSESNNVASPAYISTNEWPYWTSKYP